LRRFEFLLTFAAVFAVGWPVVFGVRPRRGIVALLLTGALIAHLQIEGYRWQMIPLYLVAVGLAVGDVIFIDRRFNWTRRTARGIFGTLGIVLAGVLPVILPVPRLPAPSGPEPMGTMTVSLIDRARDELYGPTPGVPREFVAQVWYPARAGTDAERESWSADWEVVLPAVARNLGLPSWFLDHTRYTRGEAGVGRPVAGGTFPVIIYSHGWQGTRSIALNQIESLVSNGYIVIAADHTYVAAATVLGEGQVAHQDPNALPDPAEVEPEAYDTAATDLVFTLAGDIVTILDALEEGESGPFADLAASVDLNRIGIYGHGAGGGAAVKVCLEEERCAAVLGMDPWVAPLTEDELRLTMDRPAFYMRSEGWVDTPNDALLAGIAARGASVTYWMDIDGAGHNDFAMAPLLTPLAAQFDLKGPIPAGRVIPIIDNYLLGFFDVFLLGTGTAALDTVTFPEVTLTVIDGRQ
jgi:predicted dienelactone hydrolase